MPTVEDRQVVRRGELAIELPHLDVVEVFCSSRAEHRKRHRRARLAVRITGARRDDPGNVVVAERHPHGDASATRHPGQVNPLRVNRHAVPRSGHIACTAAIDTAQGPFRDVFDPAMIHPYCSAAAWYFSTIARPRAAG